jgi:hypothetical protein
MLRRLDFLVRSFVALFAGQVQEAPSATVVVPGDGAVDLHGVTEVQVLANPDKGIKLLWLQVDNFIVASAHSSPLVFPWNTNTAANGMHVLEGDVQYKNRRSAQDRLAVNVTNTEPQPQTGKIAAAGLVYLFGGGA